MLRNLGNINSKTLHSYLVILEGINPSSISFFLIDYTKPTIIDSPAPYHSHPG